LVFSTEASAVVVAHGTTPNAAATSQTPLTTAGYGVGPQSPMPIAMSAGDRINVQAFV